MGCTNSKSGEPRSASLRAHIFWGSAANLLTPQAQQSKLTHWEVNEGPTLDEPLKYVQLIKVDALIALAEKQARQREAGEEITLLPRCQDWPPETIADANILRSWSKVHVSKRPHQITGVPIIVLSICWLDPEHPDMFGEQLAMLLPLFRLYAAEGPFAVMWDYCSLPQRNLGTDDRKPAELETFRNGLKTINRWYVHRLTTVVLVRRLPSDLTKYSNTTQYENRGWTTMERALASIVKSTSCLLDTSAADPLSIVSVDTLSKLVVSRSAPEDPGSFDLKLRAGVDMGEIKFTAMGDLDVVSEQYRTGFSDMISTTPSMYMGKLGWDDQEVARLCTSLQRCPALGLRRLRLHDNKLTDASARTLATALAAGDIMPQLELLNVDHNQLSAAAVRLLDVVCRSKGIRLSCEGQDSDEYAFAFGSPPTSPVHQSDEDDSRATFEVLNGPLQGKYDAVYLSTDLEPDDVVAIKMLAPRLRCVPLLCVVGEHTIDKRSMMVDVLKHCGVLNAHVVSGRRSQEVYPEGVDLAFQSTSRQNTARAPRFTERRLGNARMERDKCKEHVDTFLQAYASPLAILLKPLHEVRNLSPALIAKTVAVAYGSFNITKMAGVMMEEASTAGERLDKSAAYARIFEMISQFKQCVVVERATSVGRVESLNIEQPLWRYIQSDQRLMKLVLGWQATTLNNIFRDLPKLVQTMQTDVQALIRPDTSLPATGIELLGSISEDTPMATSELPIKLSNDVVHDQLVNLAEKAEKKLGVLKDICRYRRMQLPLADPLVAALLLDDNYVLGQFLKRCRLSTDAAGKVYTQPDNSSHVYWLISADESERKQMISSIHAILSSALYR